MKSDVQEMQRLNAELKEIERLKKRVGKIIGIDY